LDCDFADGRARAPPSSSRHDGHRRGRTTKKPTRRSFSAAEKLRIVREADGCTERGQIEALLRREGIYSSLLAAWRRALRLNGEVGLAHRRPGRKSARDDRDDRIASLQREVQRLEQQLARSNKIVELQKKVSELLAIDLTSNDAP
jgi:transposase-like protein